MWTSEHRRCRTVDLDADLDANLDTDLYTAMANDFYGGWHEGGSAALRGAAAPRASRGFCLRGGDA
jgi:hypothetical protein